MLSPLLFFFFNYLYFRQSPLSSITTLLSLDRRPFPIFFDFTSTRFFPPSQPRILFLVLAAFLFHQNRTGHRLTSIHGSRFTYLPSTDIPFIVRHSAASAVHRGLCVIRVLPSDPLPRSHPFLFFYPPLQPTYTHIHLFLSFCSHPSDTKYRVDTRARPRWNFAMTIQLQLGIREFPDTKGERTRSS